MFRFIKQYFFIGSLLSSNLVSTTSLSCISMNNQACQVKPEIINVNSNEPVFYPFSIKTSRCNRSYDNIDDPYAKICVLDVLKDLNVNSIQDGGSGQKGPPFPISFPPTTSTNVRINPQNFLTFSFNLFDRLI